MKMSGEVTRYPSAWASSGSVFSRNTARDALLLRPGSVMAFFTSAIDTLKILVIALGAGLGAWGVINLLEGYGNDNPGANAHVR